LGKDLKIEISGCVRWAKAGWSRRRKWKQFFFAIFADLLCERLD